MKSVRILKGDLGKKERILTYSLRAQRLGSFSLMLEENNRNISYLWRKKRKALFSELSTSKVP